MKSDDGRLPTAIRQLGGVRVVLVHGDDPDAVSAAASAVRAAAGPADPFGSLVLDGTEHRRALEEVQSPGLGCGRRVVRLRDASDGAAGSVELVLARGGTGLLVVEAGKLAPRAKLRVLVETSKVGLSIECRAPGHRDVSAAVAAHLLALGSGAEPDGLARLAGCAQGRAAALRLADLAVLLVGVERPIRAEDVAAVEGDWLSEAAEDLADHVAGGDPGEADRELESSLSMGAAPQAILRGLLTHFDRVRRVREGVDRGVSPSAAAASLRPPVFGARSQAVQRTAVEMPLASFDRTCWLLWRADRETRRTASPATALCRMAVGTLGRRRV